MSYDKEKMTKKIFAEVVTHNISSFMFECLSNIASLCFSCSVNANQNGISSSPRPLQSRVVYLRGLPNVPAPFVIISRFRRNVDSSLSSKPDTI